MRFAPVLLLLPLPAAAQDAPDIVVSGRGLPADPGERAYAGITLDRGEIDAQASNRLEDVLRAVAGLQSFRRSDSRSANPTSQGLTLRGIGGNAASRALLILDGVPQSDPFGGWVAFPAYATSRLGAIRIMRGAGGGLWGAGALAGTVEIDSAGPAELAPLEAEASYGSRNSLEAAATAALTRPGGFATLTAAFTRGDGFAPIVEGGPADRAAPYRSATVAARAAIDLGAAELQANVSGFTDRRDRGLAFTENSSDGADASLRLVGRGRWRWQALGYLQARSFASRFASVDAARAVVTPTLDQYSVPATGTGARIEVSPPLGESITLRLGADLRHVSGTTRELYTYVAGQPTRRREAGGASRTLGAFADASFTTGPLTVSLGGRVDRWTITNGRLIERPLANGPVLTDTRFSDRRGTEATGRIGGAFDPTDQLTLRAAAYRGWRLPTLNELYRPFRVGADATAANAELAPERLTGAEIGLDWRPAAGARLSLTGFDNRLHDAVANVGVASGPGTFPGVGFVSAAGTYRVRRNLPAIETRGVELDAQLTRGPWQARASWAYSDPRVDASGSPLNGLRPAQTPLHQAAATLAFAPAGGPQLGLTVRHNAAQFEDDANTRRLASATTLDARATLPLGPRLEVEARGENLTDTRVEAGVGTDGSVERTAPRTLWLGLRLRG